ncbi:IPT/TIG domain-containing protein [Bacteroides gallinaceum]|uniref:IPT/TIG domain-containing protein n=1 Tax=Bacteroides gallinaceum TaxID=1462571 RepID=UPI00195A832A|nr:IPT/TIG domain-containing protein [Bacteroides gallinaceum]MBM6659789.1 IPT/TIG domain-containing protein [Bacteroides gallinaceum]
MKNVNKIKTLLLSCLVLLGLSACDNDDLSTQQYTGGVSLNVYGPQPVVRGGTLRFLGSNLDQVTQVIIPGVNPITDIDVRQSGIPSEIWVQVPVDGPEEGYVTLVTANGEEITTLTQLTYEEPIVFEGFSPASAMPGETITITGDYLNLIHEVIFAEEVAVPEENFISHDRYQIQVVVPDSARTGEIILSDGAEELPNWIYSEEELEVGTPTVTSITTDTRFKAGERLSINGTALSLVDYVRFEGAEVPSAALAEDDKEPFNVNENGTNLTLTLPAEAASGTVELVLRSGVTVTASQHFEVVVPTDITVTTSRIKAGNALALSGNDLDLVTSLSFPSNEEGTTIDGGEFTVAANSLTLNTVPETAIDGNLSLNMANGMSVAVPYTLVKPTVTSYSANPVNAGETLTLTGTDLDLVTGVSIGGGSTATPIEGSTESNLTITVPMDSQSGPVSLILANGTSVESGTLNVNEAVFCYIANMPEEDIVVGTICQVEIANGDRLTEVQVDGTSVNYIVNGNNLLFNVPTTAGSNSTVKLISSNGEIEYTFPFVSGVAEETVIWTGNFDLGNWANGMQDLAWGGYDFSALQAGNTIIVYFTQDATASSWQLKLGRGSDWSTLPDFQEYAGGGDATDLTAGATSFSYQLGANDVNEILTNNGLIFQGANVILTQISIIY